MWYSFLADVVVSFHFAYVAYVLVGQILVVLGLCCGWSWVRNFWFRLSHLVAILVVAFETLIDVKCPLTTLEEWLRGNASGTSFIGRWLGRIMFYTPDEVSQQTLNTCYLAFALLILITFYLAPPRLPRRAQPGPPSTGAAVV
jgi:hypothetical protein